MGDTILPLVDAAADEGIEFIDTRHEGAAMHMADGYARITGLHSAATNATAPRIRAARTVMSSRFPMGVPMT